MRVHTKETQETLTPDAALQILVEGNERSMRVFTRLGWAEIPDAPEGVRRFRLAPPS